MTSSSPRSRKSRFALRAKAFLSLVLLSVTVLAHAAPTVTLSAPPNAAVYAAPVNVVLTAGASAPAPDKIANVAFYANGALVATVTASPYTYTWNSVPAGSYSITAVATDTLNATATSAARTFTVSATANPPTVSLTAPANDAIYVAPSSITVSASAAVSDANRSVAQVQFFANGVSIGVKTASPYSISWASPAPNVYTLMAVVTDSAGLQTASATRVLTVNATNTPPTVSFNAPANGAKYVSPVSVVLSATATPPEANDTVASVAFYSGTTLLATVTASPYTYTWVNPPSGSYNLTAVATDGFGATTVSPAHAITVSGTANPPTVSLSTPANNSIYVMPAAITVTASAAAGDTNLTLTQVQFFVNGSSIGTRTASPYSVAWNPGPGAYTVTAVATDSEGNTTTSTAHSVTVNATNTPPTVSLTTPPNNGKYVLPVTLALSASATPPEANDTVASVAFYQGTTLLGTALSPPYTYSWANPPAGTYTLTAVATDGFGATTTSNANTVTIANTATPPTVSLSTPANAAIYVEPATITVTASAAAGDTNLTLTQVQFFANGTVIGTRTASPWSIAWTPVPGAYALTAVATDSAGDTTTSAARTVTVNASNLPPTVTLNAPPSGAKYVLPVSIALSATATPPEANDTVASVAFYAGTTLIATVTSSPYTYTWVNPPAGSYSITAVATDGFGAQTTSLVRAITVSGAANPPTVSLSTPANNAIYVLPATITVSASAAAGDTNLTLAQVQFFANGALIGTKTASPYSIAWTPTAGTYSLTAVATDNVGDTTTSAARTVTVNATNLPPTVTLSAPPNNGVYVLPVSIALSATATPPEANDIVASVAFYAGTTLLGTVTSSPYTYTWVNPPAGSYSITAVATDGFGAQTTSTAHAITINSSPNPPTVSLSAPANNAIYVLPATVTVTASAAAGDNNLSLTQVQFFANGTPIGTKTASPWSITWVPVVGAYSLTAVATDNTGQTTTSAARTVTVNATNLPPTVTLSAPPNNGKYVLPANVVLTAVATPPEANDVVASVAFYQGTTLLGTVTAAPFTYTWVSPPVGTYSMTAVATDGYGAQATSAAISITVSNTANPPIVSLGTPANNSIYVMPANITVTASAAAGDNNLTLTQVQFFAGSTLIGTKTAAPWSIAWTPSAGTYSVTAVATDSAGDTTTSAAHAVTVNATNTPPTVSLTAPPNSGKYVLPATITVSASASPPEANDTIASVAFYQGTTLLATITTSPYTYSWVNPAAGSYTLTAVATDGFGATTTSAARTITVASTASPPTVSLSTPANAAIYVEPATITVSASAAAGDTNLTLTQVQFFASGNPIGTRTASPYSVAWNPGPGAYTVTAVATDSSGNTTTSAARSVTVNATNTPPTVTLTAPANNAKYTAPASITITATATPPEANDTVAQVAFYANGNLVGTVTASPYTFTWSNVPGGTYQLTAVATDGFGATTTSAARTVTVSNPPTATIAANPTTALAPATVMLSATASSPNGAITSVAFYQGTTLLATSTTAPYTFTVTNLAAGSYSFTARATDVLGLQGTSTPATVTVTANQPPTVNVTSPSSGATFVAPATISLSATATAPNGNVASVAFYQGTTLIGTVAGNTTSAPYTFSWTSVPQGAYQVTAKVTDNFGISTTSAPVAVTVNPNQPPTVSITAPTNNQTFAPPANITITATATAPNGNVAKVDFYQGTTLIGTATTSPYTVTWSNVAFGTYTLTAKVTDNLGFNTTSAPISILVTGTQASLYFIYTDQLNTPRAIQDQASNVVWQWDNTDPYGANVPNQDPSNSGTTFTYNPRFPGQYFDNESLLHYNYFRDYDPSTGRYAESDPVGLAAGPNTYLYVGGTPLRYIDPWGLDETNWNNSTGGRSIWDGPTNGNWGGKCWSGGAYSCGGHPMGGAQPTDSADACYMAHDKCYDQPACKSADKSVSKNAIRSCDIQLVQCLQGLPDDPKRWPHPPKPGTEGDSRRYRDAAVNYFK